MWISACRIVGGSRKRKVIKFEKNLCKMLVKEEIINKKYKTKKERLIETRKSDSESKKTKKKKEKTEKTSKKGKCTKIHNLR